MGGGRGDGGRLQNLRGCLNRCVRINTKTHIPEERERASGRRLASPSPSVSVVENQTKRRRKLPTVAMNFTGNKPSYLHWAKLALPLHPPLTQFPPLSLLQVSSSPFVNASSSLQPETSSPPPSTPLLVPPSPYNLAATVKSCILLQE